MRSTCPLESAGYGEYLTACAFTLYSALWATRCGLTWPRRNGRCLPRSRRYGWAGSNSAIMPWVSPGVSTNTINTTMNSPK